MKEAPKGQAKKAIIKGLELSQGDIIGMVGDTGAAQGCHLHFEIRKFASRFHPVWNNIYGTGDKRADPVFLRDWVDPGRLSVPRAITYDTVMVDPRGVLKGVVRLPPRSVILVDSVQCDKAALKSVSAIVPKGLKCYGQVIADGVPYLFYANWMRSLTEPGAMRVVVGGSRPQVLSDLAIVSDSVVGSIKVDDQHLEFLSVAPQPRYSEKLGHPYLRYRVVGNPGARRLQLLPSTMFAKGKSPLDLNKQQVIAASQPPAAAAPAAATAAAPQTNRTRQTYSAPVPQDSEPAGTSCGSVGRSGVITNLGDFFSCDEAAAIRAMQAGRKIVFKPSSVSFSNGKFVASMSQPSEKVLEARRRMAEGEARVRSSPPFSQKYNGNYWADWNTITQQTPFSIVCQFNTRQVVKNQEITVWAKLVNYSSRSAVLECS
jgi:murein DD-endopeptidase MepM/ murein hydrolase activator NlpD